MTGPDIYFNARTKPDAFSIALHEIGHVLGFATNLDFNYIETLDGDYDIDPNLLGGSAVASSRRITRTCWMATLLWPPVSGRGSKGISQVDALALGSTKPDWQTINPLGRSYLGGADFSDPYNWTGRDLPRGIDDAVVGKTFGVSPLATTSSNMFFNNLAINDAAWITIDHDVTVFNATVLGAIYSPGDEPRIRVRSGGSLETDDLRILGGTTLSFSAARSTSIRTSCSPASSWARERFSSGTASSARGTSPPKGGRSC